MSRLPALGSLRSIANAYEEDDISEGEELSKSAKKRKLYTNTEESEKRETKGEDSDFEIVVSDEEGNSSGAGSIKNAIAVQQPRLLSAASRLVSYGGDEDEDFNTNEVQDDKPPQDENEAKVSPEEHIQELEEAVLTEMAEPLTSAENQQRTKTPTNERPETQSKEMEDVEDKPDKMSKELLDHLDVVKSIQVALPDEPEGRCSNSLQEKIENLLETKRRTGRDLKHTIQRKKNFRNPSIYEKLVAFCAINETGTNYPEHIYDPFVWTEDSYYERLSKIQKEHHEKKQRERSKVEFVSATKKTVTTASDEASKKRKSKWDVTSAGTASLVIPQSAVHTIASVQAVVAANTKMATVQKAL